MSNEATMFLIFTFIVSKKNFLVRLFMMFCVEVNVLFRLYLLTVSKVCPAMMSFFFKKKKPYRMSHVLHFEDKTRKVKDASVQDEDTFEIYDPRNPVNKRRREESKKILREKKARR